MNALQLLWVLRGRGVHLRLDGDELVVAGPPGSMTPELRVLVRQRKSDLVRILREGCPCGECSAPGAVLHGPTCYCPACFDADPKYVALRAEITEADRREAEERATREATENLHEKSGNGTSDAVNKNGPAEDPPPETGAHRSAERTAAGPESPAEDPVQQPNAGADAAATIRDEHRQRREGPQGLDPVSVTCPPVSERMLAQRVNRFRTAVERVVHKYTPRWPEEARRLAQVLAQVGNDVAKGGS